MSGYVISITAPGIAHEMVSAYFHLHEFYLVVYASPSVLSRLAILYKV